MALELDTRQRAMLQEMGVHVWLPESGVAILEQAEPPPVVARARQTLSPTPAVQRPDPVPAAGADVATRPRNPVIPAPTTVPQPASIGTAALDWNALTEAVRNCQACRLCAGRSNATLRSPADQAECDWMVVGDAPDEDEDRAGAPFAGPDGLLLANMLRALGLQRANPQAATAPAALQSAPTAQRAYVSNVLKCRPAHGAMPQAAELAQCAAYLQREMALVRPKVILSMGRFANQLLLGESPALAAQPLGKLRGSVHSYQGTPVIVTYPPKLLMRNSADKAKAWADLCLAAATLDNVSPR